MTPEERSAIDEQDVKESFQRDAEERLQELKDKQKKEGLTAIEERELVYNTKFVNESKNTRELIFGVKDHCYKCYREYRFACVNCEKKTCGSMDDIKCTANFRNYNYEGSAFSFLYCPKCEGYVCSDCYTHKHTFWGRKRCKKCNTRLEKRKAMT